MFTVTIGDDVVISAFSLLVIKPILGAKLKHNLPYSSRANSIKFCSLALNG
ncbi:hypothetical protein SLEP1_g54956 [Rubroshorea leprosula]|uniref:Uncharacterized protein n=1 Tax=Rubroshorea leprosula TaxID=152421 RepID=A0AAV5MEA1_9ROSI|nr:hypothetical protein SLEP1_g54956 [Rubroshorea leprosula]